MSMLRKHNAFVLTSASKTQIPFGNNNQRTRMRLLPLAALAPSLLLAGCAGFTTSPSTPATFSANVTGKAFGGQQPVVGAAVQIWQAGATGYGSGAIAMLPGNGVLTNGSGSFSINRSSYSCTSGAQLYIPATGGDPGGGTNSALSLMAGLGLCDNVSSSTYVTINEVSTVGTVWALSQFLQGTATSVTAGAPATNTTGLNAAFADINSLVNIATGAAVASTTTTQTPAMEIYAIANSLAACVNSTGTTGSGPCDMLFSYTTPTGGSAPTNVLAAALNITRFPAVHANDILALASPTPPFGTTFLSAKDLTLGVTYTGNGLASPSGVAIDAGGNVWMPNASANTVTELSHTGAALSGASGFTAGALSTPSAIAIDTSGNAWIANAGNSTLTELNSSGANATGSPFSGGGLATPNSVAIDGLGNVWLANGANNSVAAFSSAGTALSGTSGFVAAGVAAPVAVAINPR